MQELENNISNRCVRTLDHSDAQEKDRKSPEHHVSVRNNEDVFWRWADEKVQLVQLEAVKLICFNVHPV